MQIFVNICTLILSLAMDCNFLHDQSNCHSTCALLTSVLLLVLKQIVEDLGNTSLNGKRHHNKRWLLKKVQICGNRNGFFRLNIISSNLIGLILSFY